MTKVRNGPKCASIGLARDALADVTHSPAFSRRARERIAGVVFADRLSMMINSRYPPGRVPRTGFSAARVWPPPLCSRVTPRNWSSPRE